MPSEFEIIRRYFDRRPRTALLGVGDDCALVKQPDGLALAITTDMLVEGVHFSADVAPDSLGHKSLAVNLSDIAAMGAEPRWATLALALPAAEESWLEAFSGGFFRLAERSHVELIGGDTTRGPLTISITLIGTSPPGLALRRDGARAGDDIWLSGRTGEAALALAARRGEIQLPSDALEVCRRRLDWPEPRVELGRALRGLAHSAIDVSDGLVQDLGHICERSRLAAEIELSALPMAPAMSYAGPQASRAMLAGGDDYELCFSAPPAARSAIEDTGRRLSIDLSRIGRMIEPKPGADKAGADAGGFGVTLIDARGERSSPDQRGYDHFG